MTIFFDLDGTLANLYDVPNWLPMLLDSNPMPYKQAKVMVNMNQLSRILSRLQHQGYNIGIISWLCKGASAEYDELVIKAKLAWLRQHLRNVNFDRIHIVKWGVNKTTFKTSPHDILFDDEEKNRDEWGDKAYDPAQIFDVLRNIA